MDPIGNKAPPASGKILSLNGNMHDVFISMAGFGRVDPKPLRLLEESGISYLANPTGGRLASGELGARIKDVRALIAGTEPVSREDIAGARRLRLISRVGAGLDSVDLRAARDCGVAVAYTPDGPSPAVAELTLGLLIDLARGITAADRRTRARRWEPQTGRRLEELTVGVFGVGRIGYRVIRLLQPFRCRILAHDRVPLPGVGPDMGVRWVGRETLLRESDLVTLHLPLGSDTRDFIAAPEIAMMKRDAALVNTSRGGIVNEADLHQALLSGRLRAAALDVFGEEPYSGPLADLESVVLTQHMGSRTEDCRLRMEVEAVEDAIRFLKGGALRNPVPMEFYSRPPEPPGGRIRR